MVEPIATNCAPSNSKQKPLEDPAENAWGDEWGAIH